MDTKLKTALAVVVGVVIGATLLGGALAVPATFHALASRQGVAERGFGMMGERPAAIGGPGMMDQRSGAIGGQGMMGPQVRGQYAPQDGTGVCPDGGQGMMGPQGRGQYAPQDGTGVCPNGQACPNVSAPPATES